MPASQLRDSLPQLPGEYVWLVHPPKGNRWIPVYDGKAGGNSNGTIRSRLGSYIKDNGTFGPGMDEAKKYWRMLDLQSRGFSVQVR